ncbi:hypothetical protein CIW50_01535 [Tardiphaga sp. P9-11]|nr:hypothetical protein CIW50_01535 [Tardiphaga sp. P9-11]
MSLVIPRIFRRAMQIQEGSAIGRALFCSPDGTLTPAHSGHPAVGHCRYGGSQLALTASDMSFAMLWAYPQYT